MATRGRIGMGLGFIVSSAGVLVGCGSGMTAAANPSPERPMVAAVSEDRSAPRPAYLPEGELRASVAAGEDGGSHRAILRSRQPRVLSLGTVQSESEVPPGWLHRVHEGLRTGIEREGRVTWLEPEAEPYDGLPQVRIDARLERLRFEDDHGSVTVRVSVVLLIVQPEGERILGTARTGAGASAPARAWSPRIADTLLGQAVGAALTSLSPDLVHALGDAELVVAAR